MYMRTFQNAFKSAFNISSLLKKNARLSFFKLKNERILKTEDS